MQGDVPELRDDTSELLGPLSELQLCDLFCVESGHRFRANRTALDGREEEVDTTRRGVAAIVREEKRYFVKDAILDI